MDYLEWFSDHYDELKKDFDKQWVIIENKSITDTCSTYDEIVQKFKTGRTGKNAMIEFIDSEQIAMFF